jgi:conjugal transfer pilus assembly protein TraB
MAHRFNIPYYSGLTHKSKQRAHMLAGGLGMVLVALVVSGMIGGPEVRTSGPADMPKPRPVGGVPGGQLDAKDAWMGGAGKELATLKDELKQKSDELTALRGEVSQTRENNRIELQRLAERISSIPQQPQGTATVSGFPIPPLPVPTPAVAPGGGIPAPQAAGAPGGGPMTFPGQRGPTRAVQTLPGVTYPPGSPAGGMQSVPAAPDADTQVPTLLRVSLTGTDVDRDGRAADAPPAPAGPGRATAAPKNLGTFLPVGFTQARLLGGLAAPTGGQAQGNPVPVLLRLVDLAVLPNGFRGQVKDCLVVAEGFGDSSAERAYIRTTLLSCVMRDGRVLEVPIKGSVFGEDGMNGMMGKLVTKQGAILTNALLAGIASGIGSGIAQATQNVSSTTLGPINTAPTDTAGIVRQGLGTGVGKALDRLAQYYISLAERTFPVIEVQPGRLVDVVITQGVSIDVALGSISPAESASPTRGTAPDSDRSALLRAVNGDGDE